MFPKQRGEWTEVRRMLEAAVFHQQTALRLAPVTPKYFEQLRRHYHNLFEALLHVKDHAAAARAVHDYRALKSGGLEILDESEIQITAARVIAGCVDLARQDAALSAERRVSLAGAYADEGLQIVSQAIKDGYQDWGALLTGHDWAALRRRPDFQQTIQELGQKVHEAELAEARKQAKAKPEDADAQDALADALDKSGLWYRYLRRPPPGLALYQESIKIREDLMRLHPEQKNYAVNLGGTLINSAHLTGDTDRTDDALALYARATALLEPLKKEAGMQEVVARFLRNLYMGRSDLYAKTGRMMEALEDIDRALGYCAEGDKHPLLMHRVDLLARHGDPKRAIAEAESLISHAGTSATDLYNLACAVALASAAIKDDGKLQEQYAARSVAILRLAAGKGYKDIEHLKTDDDLNSLRQRADYQKLLEEMGDKK
jgi:tetratricopeptide (TPR) repeat protein